MIFDLVFHDRVFPSLVAFGTLREPKPKTGELGQNTTRRLNYSGKSILEFCKIFWKFSAFALWA